MRFFSTTGSNALVSTMTSVFGAQRTSRRVSVLLDPERESGAGEGIRTLDPDLGNVRLSERKLFKSCAIRRTRFGFPEISLRTISEHPSAKIAACGAR